MVYFFLILLILFLDFKTKEAVKKTLPLGGKKDLIPGKLSLWHTKNEGVAFNHFDRHPKAVLLFTGGLLAVLSLYFLALLPKKENKGLKFSLTLLYAGALANFTDRLFHKNITDFLSIEKKKLPIFNVADIFVFLGSISLFFISLTDKKK